MDKGSEEQWAVGKVWRQGPGRAGRGERHWHALDFYWHGPSFWGDNGTAPGYRYPGKTAM